MKARHRCDPLYLPRLWTRLVRHTYRMVSVCEMSSYTLLTATAISAKPTTRIRLILTCSLRWKLIDLRLPIGRKSRFKISWLWRHPHLLCSTRSSHISRPRCSTSNSETRICTVSLAASAECDVTKSPVPRSEPFCLLGLRSAPGTRRPTQTRLRRALARRLTLHHLFTSFPQQIMLFPAHVGYHTGSLAPNLSLCISPQSKCHSQLLWAVNKAQIGATPKAVVSASPPILSGLVRPHH